MRTNQICITGERIRELYEDHNYTQKEFADFLGISTAQLRRYEKDAEQSIRSDLLIMIAKRFDVSVDYLLGLTPLTQNTHALQHLHLTTNACEKLIRGEINGDTLSRMMEHDRFVELIFETEAYFNDTRKEAITITNEITQYGTAMMRKYAHKTKYPDRVHSAADELLRQTVDAEKVQLESIAESTVSILKDVKAKIDQEKADPSLVGVRRPASLVSIQKIAEIVEEARFKSQMTSEEQVDYCVNHIVDEVGAACGVKGKALDLVKPVFRFFFRSAGKEAIQNQK